MNNSIVFAISLIFATACGTATPPAETPESKGAPSSSTAGRPTCDEIDEACDSHEHEGGLAKECHDLAEATTTPEATCSSRRAACLAACPKKAK